MDALSKIQRNTVMYHADRDHTPNDVIDDLRVHFDEIIMPTMDQINQAMMEYLLEEREPRIVFTTHALIREAIEMDALIDREQRDQILVAQKLALLSAQFHESILQLDYRSFFLFLDESFMQNVKNPNNVDGNLYAFCGISYGHKFGPYFIFAETGEGFDSEDYHTMITDELLPDLLRTPEEELPQALMHDAATYHSRVDTVEMLRRIFSDRFYARTGGSRTYPSRLTAYNPMDTLIFHRTRGIMRRARRLEGLQRTTANAQVLIRQDFRQMSQVRIQGALQVFYRDVLGFEDPNLD